MKPLTRTLSRFVMLFIAALLPGLAGAQSVAWAGSMGDRVLLVIDGRAQVVRAGSEVAGVRVHRVGGSEVEYEVGGVRQRLSAGGAPVALGAVPGAVPVTLVLEVSGDQLFHAACKVNGKPVGGVVDTGASQVSMSTSRAAALGVDWARGRPMMIQTANGQVKGWGVRLERLNVGGLEARDVEAVVLDTDLPHLLVGNSFLRRFRVLTEDGRLTVTRAS